MLNMMLDMMYRLGPLKILPFIPELKLNTEEIVIGALNALYDAIYSQI